MNPAERDNHMVWDRVRTGHYESWQLCFSHRASNTGFWLEYGLHIPLPGAGNPAAVVRLAAVSAAQGPILAVERTYPVAALLHNHTPFSLEIGPAMLRHGSAKGHLPTDLGRASWNISFIPSRRSYKPLPGPAYRLPALNNLLLVPNPSVAIFGQVQIGDHSYRLDDGPGCQSHAWGKRHPERWVWARCSQFNGDPTAYAEALTMGLHRGIPLVSALTAIRVRCREVDTTFNSLSDLVLTHSDHELGLWRFSAGHLSTKVEGEVECAHNHLLLRQDQDPDDDPIWIHQTEVAAMRIRIFKKTSLLGGWQQAALLESDHGARVEFADRLRDNRVSTEFKSLSRT